MKPTRREFLYTVGAVGAAATAIETQDIVWAPEQEPDLGWAPGIEKRVRSTCLSCPARCGTNGRVVDGKLVRLDGNRMHPMSRGGLCPRGAAGVQLQYHPDRLKGPLVRTGGRGSDEWREVTVDGAIGLMAERLGELRSSGNPQALAIVAGYSRGTMNDLLRRFTSAFGSPNYIADDGFDGTPTVMGLMHGVDRNPAYDLDRADLVVSFGAQMFESWWSPLQAYTAFAPPVDADAPRPRFIQVDTRFSKTASRAHEWIGVRPDTFAVLALGVAYVLIRDGLYDADFVARHVAGFDDRVSRGETVEGFRSRVMRNYRTEEVAAITGVPVERITGLARALAQAERPVVVCGPEVLHAPRGVVAGMAVHSLNALTGSIGREGGVLFGRDAPVAPLADIVLDEVARAGNATDPVGVEELSGRAVVRSDRFAEAVNSGSESAIQALLLYRSNPIAEANDGSEWVEALQRIPFVVSFSPFMDETSRQADLILPDLLPYERWEDARPPQSYPYEVWSVVSPMVEPYSGAVNTGDAVLRLSAALGGSVAQSLPYTGMEALLKERARGLFQLRRGMPFGDRFDRAHVRQMEERGWWMPSSENFEGFWRNIVSGGGWADPFVDVRDPDHKSRTRDGRIQLLPGDFEGEAYVDVVTEEPEPNDDYPLRLIPHQLFTLGAETLRRERWLLEQPSIMQDDVHYDPWVEVNPATAAASGLSTGDWVWVATRDHRYRARVILSVGVSPETVVVPAGPVYENGEPASPWRLLAVEVDPLTGLNSWYRTFARLERA